MYEFPVEYCFWYIYSTYNTHIDQLDILTVNILFTCRILLMLKHKPKRIYVIFSLKQKKTLPIEI